ncbi:MAG: ATP-binding cassette domain-containing protein [Cyanobacteria bacterium J06598_1]
MANVLLQNITKTFPATASKAEKNTSGDRGAVAPEHRPVLNNINLTIQDGEFMVLVGPSGCGKSTLLRLISGLETLTGGEIKIGDRTVSTLPPKQRDIAMVFQSYALYPHLTVYDNLAFGLRRALPTASYDADTETVGRSGFSSSPLEGALVGLTRKLPASLRYQSQAEKNIGDRVRSVAKMLQIETLLDRLPKQLSGGQKQRVALGRAMARNPQVFLMDEPLSNLDAKLRTETRTQIVSLQKQLKTTTIYVTHDQTEAMTMGDRIAVLNQGEIQQIAPPLELYRRPANRFVAAFIGSPPMNFLPVTVRAGQLVHPSFTIALPDAWKSAIAPYPNQSLTLGIRPEHIVIGQSHTAIPALITQYEALGSETFATATLDTTLPLDLSAHTRNPLQIRVPADQPIERGSTLQITFPPDKIHLFDQNTEAAIRP